MSSGEEITAWDKLTEAFRNIQDYVLSNSPSSSSSVTAEDVSRHQVRVINEDVCELYAPKDDNINVEIVFVHGLQQKVNDHPHITTWLTRTQPSELWPKTWLGKSKFSKARILSVSYGTLDLYREAENLISMLITNAKVGQKWGCPVIMVGHCLGGLLIKKLCVFLSNLSRYNEYAENFVENVRGVFFFATPHLGINFDVNGIALSPSWKESEILNGEMARLNGDFERLRIQKKWKIGAVGESNYTKISGHLMSFEHGVMVPEASARHCTDMFYTTSVGHFDVCKPVNKTDSTFQTLVDFVQDHINMEEASYSIENGLLADRVIVGLQASVDIVVEVLGEAQRLGIVGMPGIGKTTLAMGVFDKISREFEYACFLHKVKDMVADEVGADDLRDKIVAKLKHRGDDMDNSFSWHKLKGKKVLIILDGAEFESQVKVMTKWDDFSEDSRVIVTSRNSEFLRPQNFKIHKAGALCVDDSKILLCLHAFKKPRSPRSHEDHVTRLVEKCGGLPLALTVLGSYLYDRKVDVWEDALDKLSRTQPLNGSLQDGLWSILSWSYDSLANSEQEMFLDVATCFYGEELEEAKKAWRLCSWASTAVDSGWQNLLDRCLVGQDEMEYISMHEMLRDLGRERGGQSRMFLQGHLKANQLSRMKEKSILKVLIIASDYYSDVLKVDFLKLYGLEKLEIIWLVGFAEVRLSLRLGELPALRQLKFWHCGFIKLSKSIWEPRALQSLKNFAFCQSLEALPNPLGLLHNPQHLTIIDCSLRELPKSIGQLRALRHLEITKCYCLNALSKTLGQLQALEELIIHGCGSLTKLPKSVGQLRALRHLEITKLYRLNALPKTLGQLQALEELIINGCGSLTELPKSVGQLRALQHLEIIGCYYLNALPESVGQLRALRHLEITECHYLNALSKTLGQLQALEELIINGCGSLTELPESVGQLRALRHLEITKCYRLNALPKTLGQLQALEELIIHGCGSLTELPESVGQLRALRHLEIIGCYCLNALPESVGQLRALRHLEITNCYRLNALPKTLGQLQAMEELIIRGCGSLRELPESVGELRALRHLEIIGCYCLNALPKTLGQLQALEKLIIKSCGYFYNRAEEFLKSVWGLRALRSSEIEHSVI